MTGMGWSRVVLAGMLGVAAFQAQATCMEGCVSSFTETVPVPEMTVTVEVKPLASGLWDYVYTAQRTGRERIAPFVLSAFVLPLFEDAEIAELGVGPVDVGILNQDVVVLDLPLNAASKQIWAYNNSPPGTLSEVRQFSAIHFTSPFAPTATALAKISLTALDETIQSECCGYTTYVTYQGAEQTPVRSYAVVLPGSPLAMAASVPETSTVYLMTIGLVALFGLAKRGTPASHGSAAV